MNIFYLDDQPEIAARYHCNKHVVKMILESAQILCTAHRVLDGQEYTDFTKSGRRIKRWRLQDSELDNIFYKGTHVNHPCSKWVRKSHMNYTWLYLLLMGLLEEYTLRYKKEHKTSKLTPYLSIWPKNIPINLFTTPPQAMPDHCKMDNTIDAYRLYYLTEKIHMLQYTNTKIPYWIENSEKFKNKYPEYFI